MADLEIDNQHDFFREVRLDINGHVIASTVTQTGTLETANDAKTFYDKIALDENGNLKLII